MYYKLYSQQRVDKCKGPIDLSCSFLIVRLRWIEMHNTIHDTVAIYGIITIYGIVPLARSKPSELDQTVKRGLNLRHYSYSAQI
jgi:hypothetical protein